ncbi:hypothetical protein Tco_0679798 [Tanacetum coccineum]|uniref:Uncharacterized protein n=1 Tax=Tanacetum coccineum TaxID=301880 RepID=A0ABQ4XJ32_9ASTR
MEQMTSICDMVGQYMQKKEEEKRIAEDQAAKDRYWKIPICYDDDEDYTIAITQNSSGSTTTRSDCSLPDYEAFYFDDDHIEEKSSGSTTTHANFSQYDSFIFDLSINPFPPADRSGLLS